MKVTENIFSGLSLTDKGYDYLESIEQSEQRMINSRPDINTPTTEEYTWWGGRTPGSGHERYFFLKSVGAGKSYGFHQPLESNYRKLVSWALGKGLVVESSECIPATGDIWSLIGYLERQPESKDWGKTLRTYASIAHEKPVSEEDLDKALSYMVSRLTARGIPRRARAEVANARAATTYSEKVIALDSMVGYIHIQLLGKNMGRYYDPSIKILEELRG